MYARDSAGRLQGIENIYNEFLLILLHFLLVMFVALLLLPYSTHTQRAFSYHNIYEELLAHTLNIALLLLK